MRNEDLSVDEKLSIFKSVGESCIKIDELKHLLESGKPIRAYDGFEPSGRMHIGQGLLRVLNVNKLTRCGVKFVFWVADWFALLNNKMGGDLEKIQTVGKYMIEIWKALGMDMDNVEIVWASEEILKRPNEYWSLVFDIGRNTTMARTIRCTQIMGRSESDGLSAAQIFYPIMQCADIFFLNTQICQLGTDQLKVNVLAREYSSIKSKNLTPPIILSHSLMLGLIEGQEKMSKSQPNSSIFMDDTEQEIKTKIKKAYCPIGTVENNPIMNYYKLLIFEKCETVVVERSEKNGGNVDYTSYDIFAEDYVNGSLHPGDIKATLAKLLNEMIEPVRTHFATNVYAKQLLEKVKSYKITR